MQVIMNIIKFSVIGLVLLCSTIVSYAHGDGKPHSKSVTNLAISVVIDAKGTLWRVGVSDGFVLVSSSIDLGKTFSTPIKANPNKQKISARGEVRPKIAIGHQGEIYVTWMQNLPKRFSGYIWFARSMDNGKSFEKPMIVHKDRAEIGHAFEELVISPDGKITVLWLDGRDLVADKKVGKKRSGSSIYYTVSTDSGNSFVSEKKLADYSCECCRIATATKPDGTVTALWRHVFAGSERDHAIAEIPKGAAPVNMKRATYGRWKIDGCPHHGAALARGGGGADWWGYHMAYFDGKDKKPGLYYSRIDGEAWVAFPAKKFGDNAKQARHPALLSVGKKVWLVWLETKANLMKEVMGMTSTDGGRSWSDSQVLLSVKGKVDYPQLLQYKESAYLVVNTVNGLKVTSIKP